MLFIHMKIKVSIFFTSQLFIISFNRLINYFFGYVSKKKAYRLKNYGNLLHALSESIPFAKVRQRQRNPEAVDRRSSSKYVFLKILGPCNFIKKRLEQRCFPVNIAKFFRTSFFIEHLW